MGQKFAAFNAQGAIVAFYDSVDSPVPADVLAGLLRRFRHDVSPL
jgi:hypothetical protein